MKLDIKLFFRQKINFISIFLSLFSWPSPLILNTFCAKTTLVFVAGPINWKCYPVAGRDPEYQKADIRAQPSAFSLLLLICAVNH